MGKVRRYKKKLSKAAAVTETNGGGGEPEERPQPVDYMALAEELMELKKNDDKMSVCSVMKSVKSGGDESLKLKKDAKRFLKRAFLLKRLEKEQDIENKKKKKSRKSKGGDEDNDDDGDANDDELKISNQKVLDWPVGGAGERRGPPKKHTKGFQKKQNAQLAIDLASFSKKIKKQLKHHPVQSLPTVHKI